MRIGIDARLISETGVGRYIRNLISALGSIDTQNRYVVYLPKDVYVSFILPNERWQKRCADVHWHTIKEQVVMPFLFLRDNLDLLHVPYFNVPVLYPKRFILTIHDLTVLHVTTGKATTLPYPLYLVKKLGYLLELSIGLMRAEHIIAVSETTKKEIMDHFDIPTEKISVTYEGVDEKITAISHQLSSIRLGSLRARQVRRSGPSAIRQIQKPYFLYVGNAYPHKNLELLVDAFAGFIRDNEEYAKYRLFMIGGKDYFYGRLEESVRKKKLDSHILFLGSVSDEALKALYQGAKACVFPSRMEGFGLPVLEALILRCPVIASDIPVFRELFGDLPRYFDPSSYQSLMEQLSSSVRNQKRIDPRAVSSLRKRFSWKDLAQKTLRIYNSQKIVDGS